MDKKFYRQNRARLLRALPEERAMVVLSSGYEITRSADECYDFQVNNNFFYLAGITQPMVHLILWKNGDQTGERLFIDAFDETYAKWIGHRLTKPEASALSGVAQKNIVYRDRFEEDLAALCEEYPAVYLDLEKRDTVNFCSFGLSLRDTLAAKGTAAQDVYPLVTRLRAAKQAAEVELLRTAVANTKAGIEELMRQARPGMYEYELEAYFDHSIKRAGQKAHSFRTIAAGGIHATTLHYSANNDTLKDGELVLFDLGCREQGYCADITRTFPVNGRFSALQRAIYEVVLAANKKVARVAKAGMTMAQLQEICVAELTKGCLRLGLIEEPEEIKQYYFHGVSHSIGLDTHDPYSRSEPLPVGAVISDEPGLYFPQYGIGIRIEDDLLILKSKAVNLSADIIKEPDDIEAFMAAHKA